MTAVKQKAEAQKFLDPKALLEAIPIEQGSIVADFGCGNGYYAVAASELVGRNGQVWALDILEDSLSQTATLGKLVGVTNLSTKQCDLERLGSCPIADMSADYVLIASLLHQAENKDNVIREAYRVLKTGGKILIVEWNGGSKFGPVAADRVSRDQAEKFLEKYGFHPVKQIPAGAFHYALLYQK